MTNPGQDAGGNNVRVHMEGGISVTTKGLETHRIVQDKVCLKVRCHWKIFICRAFDSLSVSMLMIRTQCLCHGVVWSTRTCNSDAAFKTAHPKVVFNLQLQALNPR